jgi:hypothetical protein
MVIVTGTKLIVQFSRRLLTSTRNLYAKQTVVVQDQTFKMEHKKFVKHRILGNMCVVDKI